MIDYVAVYMYPLEDTHPFAAIRRGSKIRFIKLTRDGAWGLARACRARRGRFYPDGVGWNWSRTHKAAYSEGCLDNGTPLIE